MSRITLAGGCFWCTEAIFRRLKGVSSVTSGYTGGDPSRISYDEVSTGATGHAEAIDIEFDEATTSLETLLDIFFATHDPTTINRQGNDVGTQYRSAIFYRDEAQKQEVDKYMRELSKSGKYKNKIVTEITKFNDFFPAEDYHRDYYEKNKSAPYCQVIIDPKINKLLNNFSSELRSEYIESIQK